MGIGPTQRNLRNFNPIKYVFVEPAEGARKVFRLSKMVGQAYYLRLEASVVQP